MCDTCNQAAAQAPQCPSPANSQFEEARAVLRGDNARTYRPPTMQEQAEKAADHHAEQHGKQRAAANFFAAHPEFDQFIQLVRQGAIQF